MLFLCGKGSNYLLERCFQFQPRLGIRLFLLVFHFWSFLRCLILSHWNWRTEFGYWHKLFQTAYHFQNSVASLNYLLKRVSRHFPTDNDNDNEEQKKAGTALLSLWAVGTWLRVCPYPPASESPGKSQPGFSGKISCTPHCFYTTDLIEIIQFILQVSLQECTECRQLKDWDYADLFRLCAD